MTDDSTLARIVSERPRFKSIDLEWPVAFGGKDYRAITVSRLTAPYLFKVSQDTCSTATLAS